MLNITHSRGTKCGIYKITNLNTGDFYIGSSLNIYYRLRRHLSDLRKKKHANPKLSNSFNKHGESAFESKIVEETEPKKLLEREEHWINSLSPKYNCLGLKLLRPVNSKEMRRKVSKATTLAIEEGRLTCGRKSIDVFDLTGKKLGTYPSIKDVVAAYPVSHDSVTRVLKGKHQQNKGYIFRLAKYAIKSVTYSKKPHDLSALHKIVKCENVLTGEVEWFDSFKETKSKFGVTLIYNIKTGSLYNKTYRFSYATKPDELLGTPDVKQDNQQPSISGMI